MHANMPWLTCPHARGQCLPSQTTCLWSSSRCISKDMSFSICRSLLGFCWLISQHCCTGLRSRHMSTIVNGHLKTEVLGVVPRVRPAQAVNMRPSFLRSSLVLLLLPNRMPMVGCLPASYILSKQTDTAYLYYFTNGSLSLSLFKIRRW